MRSAHTIQFRLVGVKLMESKAYINYPVEPVIPISSPYLRVNLATHNALKYYAINVSVKYLKRKIVI